MYMASGPQNKYTAADLARLTGVTVRTVRYYIRIKLIDPPLGRGRGPHFGDRHLNQLRRVRYMQARGLDLEAIRRQFEAIRQRIRESGASEDDPRVQKSWPPEMIALDTPISPFLLPPRRVGHATTTLVTRLDLSPGISLHVEPPHRLPGSRRLAELTQILRLFFDLDGGDDDDGEED